MPSDDPAGPIPKNPPDDTWAGLMAYYKRVYDDGDAVHERVFTGGRPRGDRFPGARHNVYLRADVWDWLRAEADARGNGATVSTIINAIVRAACATQTKAQG